MDYIIEGLVNIEEEAYKLTKEAEDEFKNLQSKIADKTDLIFEQVSSQTDAMIKEFNETAKDEKISKIRKIKEKSKYDIENLKLIFETNHKNWEQEIFNKILSE